MKKALSLLLVVSLLLVTVTAFAETAAETVINWSDFQEKAAECPGSFVKLADSGLMIYMPDGWVDGPVSEEAQAKGTFLNLQTTEDTSDPAFTVVSGQLLAVTVADFKALMEKENPGCSEEGTLNGISVVSCQVEANGAKAIVFAFSAAEGAQTIVISFAPVTDDNGSLVALMAASLQPVQE